MMIQMNKKHGILWYCGIFMLSVLLYIVVIAVEGAYPFGDRCFLADDAYVQYNTMLRTLIEFLKSGDKSVILWNRGLGTDMYLTALYYLMSPFNLIAVMLGADNVELSLIIIIVLKCSLIPVTGLYYFRHTSIQTGKKNPWICGCCALAWGFCGYIIAYGQNLIWLDALIIVPLLAFAVEKVCSGEGYWKYIVLLAAVFVFNFYYAFYVCMFIVVYFLLLRRDSIRKLFGDGFRILGLSVIAVMIAGIVLVPAAMAIMKAGDTTLDNQGILDMWGNLGHYIVSFFPFKEVTNGYLYNSNNYCGTLVVMMLFMFVASSSVPFGEKVKYVAVAAVFMLAANFLPLNYVFHGFVVTHGTGNRFAVILTFVLILIAYRMLHSLENIGVWPVAVSGVLCILAFVLAFTDNSRLQVMYSYIVFMFVIVVNLITLILMARKSISVRTALMIIVALWFAEICCNTVYTMKDKANEGNMIDNIHLSEWDARYEFLHTGGDARKTVIINDNYVQKSDVNWYSSMINGYFVNAFSYMGLSHFDNVECVYDGTTPLTAMMYNVRYVLTNSRNTNGGYHEIFRNDLYGVYEADELAGWGFMMNPEITGWTCDKNVAQNQSDFVALGWGGEAGDSKIMNVIPWGDIGRDTAYRMGMLHRYAGDDGYGIQTAYNAGEFQETGVGSYVYTGTSTMYHACVLLRFTPDRDMDLYVYSADNRDQAVTIYVDGREVSSVMYTSSGQLVYGGHVNKGQNVKMTVMGGASMGDKAEKRIQLYSFDTEEFNRIKPYITDEVLASDGYKGNTFKGHITANNDGILYLAFPYSDGYRIRVDGQDAEKILLGKGNMGVQLRKGEHEIELEYHTPGIKYGVVMSLAGLIALVILCIWTARKKDVVKNS